MKIDSPFVPLVNNKDVKKSGDRSAPPAGLEPEAKETKTEESGDVVRLSERARLAARATELAHAAPEVRQEKVDSLKSRIQAGTYNVSGRVAAEAMIRKSITEV